MKDVMLDLETLSTDPRGVIVSIGAVFFDKDSVGDTFYRVLNLDDQLAKGRIKSDSTMAWWAQQSKEAQSVFDKKRIPTKKALTEFAKWYSGSECLWGNGADFDNVLLGTLYDDFGIKRPWSYGSSRCFRTLKNICKAESIEGRQGTYHNALDDAVFQAKAAQAYFKGGLK